MKNCGPGMPPSFGKDEAPGKTSKPEGNRMPFGKKSKRGGRKTGRGGSR